MARSPFCAAPAGRLRAAERWALVFELTMHDGAGRLAARDVLCLVVSVSRPVRVHRGTVCRLCTLLAASPEVRALVDREIDARRRSTRDELARTAAAIERRLLALAAEIERAEPRLIQTSLFDTRAERQARANDLTAAARRRHVQHRLGTIRTLARDEVSACACLVAAWPWVE